MSDDKKPRVLSLVGKIKEKATEADAGKEAQIRAFGEKLIGEVRGAIDEGLTGYVLITVDRKGNPGVTWHSGFNNAIPLLGALPVLEAQLVREAIAKAEPEEKDPT